MVRNHFIKCNFKGILQFITVLLALQTVCLQNITKLTLNNDVTTCSTNTIATRTVFEFWQEATERCDLDPKNLFKIYKKFVANFETHINDKISELLSDHVSSSLMDSVSSKIIEAISTQSLSAKPDLVIMINELYKEDTSYVIKIWQKVLDETFLFIDIQKVIDQILLLNNDQLKFEIMEYLLKKYDTQYKHDQRFLPLLTYGITTLHKQRQQQPPPPPAAKEDRQIEVLLKQLPEQLLTIYQSWNYNVSILNQQYDEYIFAERFQETARNRLHLFTFVPNKKALRVRGKLRLRINTQGMLAFGAFYNGTIQYLNAGNETAYFCWDCYPNDTQWWQVLWPEGNDVVMFQNLVTKDLLCATIKYDEISRLVTSLSSKTHMTDSACRWKVSKRIK